MIPDFCQKTSLLIITKFKHFYNMASKQLSMLKFISNYTIGVSVLFVCLFVYL